LSSEIGAVPTHRIFPAVVRDCFVRAGRFRLGFPTFHAKRRASMTFVQDQESVEKGSGLRSEGSELPLPKAVQPRRRKPRLFLRVLLVGIGMVLVLLLVRWLLVPGAMERKEIAPGVFLEVHHFNQPGTAEGAVMVAEIHWDTPGVEIVIRPFDESLSPEAHYRLASPSWLTFIDDYLVLLNGTRFGPGDWYKNYPGSPVYTHETSIVKGEWSHVHEHSYLLWWDRDGGAHFDQTKPPTEESRANAYNGIGFQAVQVAFGKVRKGALGGHLDGGQFSQSFIGVDPDNKIVWLVAYEHTTELFASSFIADRGAQFAGRLDSGRGTAMVAGPRVKGVFPFSGIRNERLVGNYVAVRYKAP
jgi:hypothetical protein